MLPLDLDVIIANIDFKYRRLLTKKNFALFNQINSTNSYLLECYRLRNHQLIFCIADHQTAGRGRLSRAWLSPPGNIYLSFLRYFNLEINKLSGLNIAIAIAISRALKKAGVPKIYLKWPNDLIYNDGKLAGILIETITNSKYTVAVIGIGINLVTSQIVSNHLGTMLQPESLQNIIDKIPNRNILIGMIISEIFKILDIFEKTGLNLELIQEWQQQNYHFNQEIKIDTGNTTIQGINLGIDQQGNLLLALKNSVHLSDLQKMNPLQELANNASQQFNPARSDHHAHQNIVKFHTISSGEIIAIIK